MTTKQKKGAWPAGEAGTKRHNQQKGSAMRVQFPRVNTLTDEQAAKVTSPSTQMAVAMAATGKPFYEGTVPAATKARRRAKNKAARRARRAAR